MTFPFTRYRYSAFTGTHIWPFRIVLKLSVIMFFPDRMAVSAFSRMDRSSFSMSMRQDLKVFDAWSLTWPLWICWLMASRRS